MKILLTAMALTFTANSFAIDIEKELFGRNPSLELVESQGPHWRQKIIDSAIEEWEKVEDFYNLFDDGMNHQALEKCEPKADVIDYEINTSPNLGGSFKAVKKIKGSSRSVAYVVIPSATYEITYTVLVGKKNNQLKVSCTVDYSQGFFFKNNESREIEFLGNFDL